MITDLVTKSACVGCKACLDICSRKAITFKTGRDGFWYPVVDKSKCNECGLCSKVCPALKQHILSKEILKEPIAFKVYHKDPNVRYNSTSGALYYGLAKPFIDKKEYIAGCLFSEDYSKAFHDIGNTQEFLNKVVRSKYFQSDTEGIFLKVRKQLLLGKKVLFCGTPCQISALNGFLGKEYDNLFTAELICRGINSPLAYTKFIEELEQKYKSKVSEVHFKNKSHGWTKLGTLVKFENGKKYYRHRFNDPWVNGFVVGNLFLRECCSNCKYKSFPRCADITLGDFWGLKLSKEERKLGVSVAIVNTEKGRRLLQQSFDELFIEPKELSLAVKGNPALEHSSTLSEKRSAFFDRIASENFSTVVWSLLNSSKYKRLKNQYALALKSHCKSIIKFILRRCKIIR